MKLVLLIWIGWLLAAPVYADTPPQLQGPLVADEGLQGHRDYLNSRLALGRTTLSARVRFIGGERHSCTPSQIR